MIPKLEKPAPIPATLDKPKPQTDSPDSDSDHNHPKTSHSPKNKPKKGINGKTALIVGSVIFVIIALLLTNLMNSKSPSNKNSKGNIIIPTPTMIPRPTIPEFSLGEPTLYSNDPQILQLEGALKNYERQLDSIDYQEQDLTPPTLLMNVNFKK